MKSLDCSQKAREQLATDVRRKLAQHSNFSCSICGAIPIIFHHIEEWSRSFSNDEELLIPICDKCHRGIHGEGGTLFSKEELYEYKANPKRPSLLTDKLPLERKKSYSFFVGNNFITNNVKVSLFSFSHGHNLLTVDTSTGSLMLTILAEIQNGNLIYLIQNNELMVNSTDVWDMHYSRSSLKIWKSNNEEKMVVIDLAIKPDVIILREMATTFDGKPFRIYRLRKPQQRQVNKIRGVVQECEELFKKKAEEIDKQPKKDGPPNSSIDFDKFIKETDKEILKTKIKEFLTYEFCHEFNWDWHYYVKVLNKVLAESPVFDHKPDLLTNHSERFKQANNTIATMKAKYQTELEDLEDLVVEYNGSFWSGNIQV